MSWRRGELWLDWDVRWFREGAFAPSLPGFAPAPMPSFGPPPGLIASRKRREAWRQKRYARKVRTATLVIAPAVMFPLTALRNGQGQTSGLAADDPPSLTFRLGISELEAADARIARKVAAMPLPRPHVVPKVKPAKRVVTRAVTYPAVVWHHATSVGLPWDGSLIDGTQLPLEGANWVTWDPVTKTVPNEPHRLYGNEHTIHAIISVIDAYRAAHPDAPRVVVGDISLEGGGPMTDEHVSHQNGLDADIYYPRLDGKLEDPVTPDNIDRALAQDLVNRFVAAGAQLVLVGFDTGLTGPSGVVVPYAGHDNHMHVRFPNPG